MKATDRFTRWLGMWRGLEAAGADEMDVKVAEFARRGEQFARWLGVSERELADLLHSANDTLPTAPTACYPQVGVLVDGSWGPGGAYVGASIVVGDREVESHSRIPVPAATNNETEYHAILFGLEQAIRLQADKVFVWSDSQLAVRQINRQYACNKVGLVELRERVWDVAKTFSHCEFIWWERERNQRADALATGLTDEEAGRLVFRPDKPSNGCDFLREAEVFNAH